ncbi:MAG: hypothetical protein ISR64_10175 [Deltaproteobacteria bacterium]|nr:hypothetical protein [Deltaproteobacteria bacterium]
MSRLKNMVVGLAVVLSLACSGGSDHGGDAATDPGDPGPEVVSTPCHDEAPIGKKCDGFGTCQFGQECCCGDCHPVMVCTCTGEFWGCWYTDGCLGPCP